ncbi:MAG TPA: hypothetical protein VG889_06645 [Rhizomicrobium sp.]|nr:hypothetical protein [Rhizomicrobium sp.]
MRPILFALLIATLSRPAFAGEADAQANWRMAGMLAEGGIPNRTAVCATLAPRGAGKDDTAAIQNAIDACPDGQVVQLAAGRFTIEEGNLVLIHKPVTLRGAGPGATVLTRKGGAKLGSDQPGESPSPMIVLGPQRYNNDTAAIALTADAKHGAASVAVASAQGFSVGQVVLLDEASGASWQPDVEGLGRIWASRDYRVVWQKHDPPQPFLDDFDAEQFPDQPGSAGCWFSNCDRPTAELHRIAAVSGNTIAFDSPATISYRTSHDAQLYRFQTPLTERAGLEALTVEHGDDDNIDFFWCANCWAKDVESTLWLGAGFGISSSFRVELNAFYAHKPVWPVPGGGGYNISLANAASEILIWNGISVLGNKVMVGRSAGAGSVAAYNYMDMGFIGGTGGWQEVGLNNSHMVGSHHMLFEGNWAFNIDSDQTHGNAIYNTFFRNHTTGFRARFKDYLTGAVVDDVRRQSANGPLRAASAHAYSYWNSFVGNVFGTPHRMDGFIYGDEALADGDWPPQILMMGWDDQPGQVYDPNVAATNLVDGNYDYKTRSVKWADKRHHLPDSLFLTKAPEFFDGYRWPWVEPTGATKLYLLPAKARYDAGTPFAKR